MDDKAMKELVARVMERKHDIETAMVLMHLAGVIETLRSVSDTTDLPGLIAEIESGDFSP